MTPIEQINIFDHHDDKIKWNIKKDALKLYKALKTHADGLVPEEIIKERRPNEPDAIMDYRFKIYAPKTEHPISKVITSLTKIRRSPDWKVDYDATKEPAFLVSADKTLKRYLESEYPVYDNLDSWLFDECLQNIMIDANAVCVIVPLSYNIEVGEFYKPIPFIANVDEVIYYKENDYTIVKTDRDYEYTDESGKREYDIHILSTRNEIVEYVILETKGQKVYFELKRLQHNFDELQAFRFRGLFYKNEDGDIIWKTPINPMVTHLNEAARLYSDEQAEYVLHMHSEKWTINTNTCKKCNGTGKTKLGLAMTNSVCGSCNGSGYDTVSPFQNRVINLDLNRPNSQIPPIPPAGYIQKNIDIAHLLRDAVKSNLYEALEAVNMQFLYNVPIDESGIAKQWDRDETDNFAHKVAGLLKYVRENVAYYTCNLRYGFLIQDAKKREEMLPTISIPQKYDLVNNALLIEEYKQAKEANLSPVILASMEMEISLKRFTHDSDVSKYTMLVYKLDPLYGVSEDNKMMRLQNNGITEKDYVVSSNIQKFVRKALIEDEQFAFKGYAEQVAVMNKYADEVMKENSISTDLLAPLENGLDPTQSGNQLAQSVGGLTGMIEIVKAVASGVYDLEAAVSLVAQRFGISEDEARKQLGTPQIIQSEQQADKVATLT